MKKTRFRETDVCLADQKLSTFMKAYIYYPAQQWPTTWPYFEGECNPYLGSFCPCHEQKKHSNHLHLGLKSVLFSLTIPTKNFMFFSKDTYITFDYFLLHFTVL